MRFYLSSYKFGDDIKQFTELLTDNTRLAYIPNAGDGFPDGLSRKYDANVLKEMEDFFKTNSVTIRIEMVDLRTYFDRQAELKSKLQTFGIIWVRGGNVFVLREAMRKSGFDQAIRELVDEGADIVYGGFSAGIVVLSKTLEGIHIMNDLTHDIYGPIVYNIDGIGLLDYLIVPHFESPGYSETHLADLTVEYMKKHHLPYRTLRDGEAIVINDIKNHAYSKPD